LLGSYVSLNNVSNRRSIVDAIINWFNGLSRNTKIALLVAVSIFTPAVGILFSIVFSGIGAIFTVIGFIFGFVNWGVLFLLIIGFGGYKGYKWIQENGSLDEDAEEDDLGWDPFR
jgi:uncharacterized membrane protein required for colicin V production